MTSSRRGGRSTAIGDRRGFGINLDPSHFVPQFLDPAAFALEFAERIYHVHIKDAKRRLDGRRSILGAHLDFGAAERGWDFVSPGHGDVDFEAFFRALNRIGYDGPLSIEWEDSRHGSGVGRARTRSRSCANGLRALQQSRSTRRCRGGMSVPASDHETGEPAEIRSVGMLGYAFMGKAHSNAYRTLRT